MRNIQETKSQIAVSRASEAALNTAATLDERFILDSGSLLKIDYDREDNADEINGFEGASEIIPFGRLSSAEFSQKRAKPAFILWAMAHALGACATADSGDTGYKHTITPVAGGQMSSFTAAQILGRTLLRERYCGNVVSEVTIGLTDKWIEAKAAIKGTGKRDVDYVAETVTAAENATQLTVLQDIEGADEAARTDSIHLVRVKKTGETHWTHVTVTGSSAAKKIEIAAAGSGEGNVDFEVIYVPTVQAYFTLPDVTVEPYLKITDLTVRVGGEWNGTAIVGGRLLSGDFLTGELKVSNEAEVRFVPGSGIDYGGDVERSGRSIILSLSKKMRDAVMEYQLAQNEYFAASVKITGPEYESGKNFEIEFILPRLGINSKQITVNNKVFAEEGDLIALEGATLNDEEVPPIIVIGQNQVAWYLVEPD